MRARAERIVTELAMLQREQEVASVLKGPQVKVSASAEAVGTAEDSTDTGVAEAPSVLGSSTKQVEGSAIAGTNLSSLVICLCNVKCRRSLGSLRPYSSRNNPKHSLGPNANSGAGFLMNTRRSRGSVDCKFASFALEDQISKSSSDAKARSSQAGEAYRVCAS